MTEPAGIDPARPDPRGPLTGDVMAEMDAHLDAEMARLLAAAEEADRMAEIDEAYQLRRAMERHPSAGYDVTRVGNFTRIEAPETFPQLPLIPSRLGRRIASVAASVLLMGGGFLGVLVVTGHLPRLAGPTLLCAICLGAGVGITCWLESTTKGPS